MIQRLINIGSVFQAGRYQRMMHPAVSCRIIACVQSVTVRKRRFCRLFQFFVILCLICRPCHIQMTDMSMIIVFCIILGCPFPKRAVSSGRGFHTGFSVIFIIRKTSQNLFPSCDILFFAFPVYCIFHCYGHLQSILCRRNIHCGVHGHSACISQRMIFR